MPTNLLLSSKEYGPWTDVIATLEGSRVPRMATIDLDSVATDRNGNKYLKAGTVIVKGSDGFGRPYPVSQIASTAITTASTVITVTDASLFKEGDVLVVMQPYARADLASTWANADTATVEFDGQSITHTVADFTSLTALATAIAQTLNDSVLSKKVTVIAEAQHLHFFGKDGRNYPISVSEVTAGTGTFTLDGSVTALQSNVSIEEIDIDGVNPTTNTLTLADTADRRLPIGAPIGVNDLAGEIWGMVAVMVDLNHQSNDVGCYTALSVYGARLPYWDGILQAALPEITLV